MWNLLICVWQPSTAGENKPEITRVCNFGEECWLWKEAVWSLFRNWREWNLNLWPTGLHFGAPATKVSSPNKYIDKIGRPPTWGLYSSVGKSTSTLLRGCICSSPAHVTFSLFNPALLKIYPGKFPLWLLLDTFELLKFLHCGETQCTCRQCLLKNTLMYAKRKPSK